MKSVRGKKLGRISRCLWLLVAGLTSFVICLILGCALVGAAVTFVEVGIMAARQIGQFLSHFTSVIQLLLLSALLISYFEDLSLITAKADADSEEKVNESESI